MITRIEALNYRCLRYINQAVGPFNVLVGPNASGKTTFLDVVSFLSDLVSKKRGFSVAITDRTQNFCDLVWGRELAGFELAVEAKIPEDRRLLMAEELQCCTTIRYAVRLKVDPDTAETFIDEEHGTLVQESTKRPIQKGFFPSPDEPPDSILSGRKRGKSKRLFSKGVNDNYYSEVYPKEGRWAPSFKFGPRESTLGNLPDDEVTVHALGINEGVG